MKEPGNKKESMDTEAKLSRMMNFLSNQSTSNKEILTRRDQIAMRTLTTLLEHKLRETEPFDVNVVIRLAVEVADKLINELDTKTYTNGSDTNTEQ